MTLATEVILYHLKFPNQNWTEATVEEICPADTNKEYMDVYIRNNYLTIDFYDSKDNRSYPLRSMNYLTSSIVKYDIYYSQVAIKIGDNPHDLQ